MSLSSANFHGKKRCSIVFLRDVDFSGETGCVTINTHAFWRQVVMRKIFEKKLHKIITCAIYLVASKWGSLTRSEINFALKENGINNASSVGEPQVPNN